MLRIRKVIALAFVQNAYVVALNTHPHPYPLPEGEGFY